MAKYRRATLFVTALILLSSLGYSIMSRLAAYRRHEVGVSVTKVENFASELPFPAVTVCTWHYEMESFNRDMGIVSIASLFSKKERTYMSDPMIAYENLLKKGVRIETFLRKYYITLDKIFRKSLSFGLHPGCKIGGFLCEVSELPEWKEDQDELQVHVPAGVWTSRFLADSDKGFNALCHTLKPNVSVDFASDGGSAMEMRWNNELLRYVPSWQLYLHDSREHVSLKSYAMKDMPMLTFQRPKQGSELSHVALARLKPRLNLEAGTPTYPCEDPDSYSHNLCNLKRFWKCRLDSLKLYYGNRLRCVIPGLLLDGEQYQLPYCRLATGRYLPDGNMTLDSNSSVGYVDLINPMGTITGVQVKSSILLFTFSKIHCDLNCVGSQEHSKSDLPTYRS